MAKPVCLKSQTVYQITCVYNAWCNYFQLSGLNKISQKDWELDFMIYWTTLPSTKRLNAKRRKAELKGLIGPRGYSPDVLKLYLHASGLAFKEIGALSDNFAA
jgi:hypothetical protein